MWTDDSNNRQTAMTIYNGSRMKAIVTAIVTAIMIASKGS
jgi:hypothetical protein